MFAEMTASVAELYVVMALSSISLLFPFNMVAQMLVLKKTHRTASAWSPANLLDACIFTCLVIAVLTYFRFIVQDPENDFISISFKGYTDQQVFMLNVMWCIHTNEFRFDFLLALLVLFQWMRFILYFRTWQTFGPMFEIIQEMVVRLSKVLTIWFLVQAMFASCAILAFSKLNSFQGIADSLLYFFNASLGSWDMEVFEYYD